MNRCSIPTMFLIALLWPLPMRTNASGAEELGDPCRCNAVLLGGVYSYRAVRGDQQAKEATEREMARMTFDEFKRTVKAAGGIKVEGFGSLSGDHGDSEFRKAHSTLQEKYKSTKESMSSHELVEKFGDKEVLAAWNQCRASTTCEKGLRSWIKEVDESAFTLYLRWDPPDGASYPSVGDSLVTNGTVRFPFVEKGGVMRRGTQLQVGDNPISIDRDRADAVVRINIAINGARSISEVIPKHIDSKPRFVSNRDGTVTDTANGWMWTRASISGLGVQQALEYASGLGYANHEDWGLPTEAQLDSLFDKESKQEYKVVSAVSIDAPSVWARPRADKISPVDQIGYDYATFDFKSGQVRLTNYQGFERNQTQSNHPRTLCVRSIRQ